MSKFYRWALGSAALLGLGISAGTVAPLVTSAPARAQTTFSDVEPSYWAQPFIEGLAAQNIISGYPDGTFRPEQPLDRDEFAALIRDAFNQNEVRQIPSGSVFKDVPAGYWAGSAIEEAYEAGFMRGFPGGLFRPREEVSRVQALVSLVNGLNLSLGSPQANASATTNQATTPATTRQTTTPATTSQATTPTTTSQATTPATRRRATKKPIFIPLAITSLMQPLLIASANGQGLPPSSTTESVASEQGVSSSGSAPTVASGQGMSPRGSTESVPSDQSVATNRPPSFVVSDYYTDAKQIPQYAVDDVVAATRANIVVNYPNVRALNPNEPLSRGAAAAWIYQALVKQGKLSPLPSSVQASNYIVGLPSK